MKKILLILLAFVCTQSIKAQVPDFTMTDINGNSHSLYADYLDQGKPVFISVAATWNPWDSVWVDSGVMDDFQAQYGNDAVIMFIEGDTNTLEGDLYGTGNSGTYDFVTGHDYLIMDDSAGIMQDDYGITFFPFVFVICPDGTGYTQSPGNNNFEVDDDVFYGNFQTAEDIADKMYQHCGTDFDRNKLNGVVYTDLDFDCDQTGENRIPLMIANIDGPTGSFYRITDDAGEFRTLADEGEYTVEVMSPNGLWDVCDNPQSYTFVGTQDSINMDFGLQSVMPCTDPTIEISAPFLVRCFETSIYVHYCNEGTIPVEDVVVTVTLDSFLLVDNISQVPSSQSGFTYTFDIGTLEIFECGDIVFDITVDCESELGTEQCYSAVISPEPDCIQSLLAETAECQPIVGSYDPNDKRAYPFQEGDDYAVGPNETVKYQIRFQNTGSFTAFNVVVLDTISPFLDLSTFRMGNASHDYEVTIEDHRTLRVAFNDILLPDSTANEAASHGFFTYYIDQVADLPDGTKFTNNAGIYFDFNDPVITNTTIHTVDYNIVSNDDINAKGIGFSLSPNPATDIIQVSIKDLKINNGQYELMNVNGQQLLKGNFNASQFGLSVETLPTGIYFLQLNDTKGNTGVQKIVIR